MRKQPTGEPCAGELHARFGGRGDVSLSDPYPIPVSGHLKLDIRKLVYMV